MIKLELARVPCVWCLKEFQPKRRTGHFCSQDCYKAYWYILNSGPILEKAHKQTKERREYLNKWYHRRKAKVFDYFGGKCEDCGIEDFDILTIDHVSGGGQLHRKEFPSTGDFYSWVHNKIKNKQKIEGLAVVCRNCNWKRHLKKIRDAKDYHK